ncbi:MAG: hypothetical protein ACXVXM_04780 [Nocardioidaceae bacterium]
MQILTGDEWAARRAAHEARVDAWTGPHLARRREGVPHPVHDFLFTYYAQRRPRCAAGTPGSGSGCRPTRRRSTAG